MSTTRLTLFHTNDIHSCFSNWSKIVSYIKRHRDENTLYLELGDHTDRSHPLTEATSGKGNIQLLNEANVDIAAIGNNEGITFTKTQLESLYDNAQFPVLVANLFHPDGKQPAWAKQSFIYTLPNDVTVGVIGLTAPFSYFYEQLGWKIRAPEEMIRKILPKIRPHVDVVIVMSHLGLHADRKMAMEFSGIDVIIGAHTHHVLPKGEQVGDTLIAQTGKLGSFLGEVSILFDIYANKIVETKAVLHDVTSGPSDPKTDELLKDLTKKSTHILAERVAYMPRPFPVHWQKETEITQLLCDTIAEWCGEKLAMMNAGILLDSIEEGYVTKGDIHRICPHPINVCVVKILGNDLRKAIERAFTEEMRTLRLKGFGFRGELLGRMIFTGIDVTFKRENKVKDIFILGDKLQEDEMYSLATLDMYTFGSLYPSISSCVEKKYFMPEFLRDIFAWKLGQLWS